MSDVEGFEVVVHPPGVTDQVCAGRLEQVAIIRDSTPDGPVGPHRLVLIIEGHEAHRYGIALDGPTLAAIDAARAELDRIEAGR